MIRRLLVVSLALAFAVGAPARALAQGVEGAWKLSYVTTANLELTAAIVKLKVDGGKTTGELVAGSPRIPNLTLKSVVQEGSTLRIGLQGAAELIFDAAVPKEAGKRMQ